MHHSAGVASCAHVDRDLRTHFALKAKLADCARLALPIVPRVHSGFPSGAEKTGRVASPGTASCHSLPPCAHSLRQNAVLQMLLATGATALPSVPGIYGFCLDSASMALRAFSAGAVGREGLVHDLSPILLDLCCTRLARGPQRLCGQRHLARTPSSQKRCCSEVPSRRRSCSRSCRGPYDFWNRAEKNGRQHQGEHGEDTSRCEKRSGHDRQARAVANFICNLSAHLWQHRLHKEGLRQQGRAGLAVLSISVGASRRVGSRHRGRLSGRGSACRCEPP